MSDPTVEIGAVTYRLDEDCDDGIMHYHWLGDAEPACPCGGEIDPRVRVEPWTGDEWIECLECDRKFDVVRG